MEKLSPVAQQYVTNSQGTMDTVTVQTAPQVVQPTVSTVQKPDTFVNSSSIQQTKQIDKKKVIIGVGIALAAVAAVAAIVHGAKTGKIGKSKETTQKAIEEVKKEVKKEATSEKTKEVVKGLKDIKFDKGVASLKDSGEKFTGKLAHTYKNGDKVVLEYADGILKKSTGEGTKSFEKVYQTVNGEKLVRKTVNGKAETVNITKIQNEVKLAQEKLKSLLANKDISAEDFEKQAKDIKYKSKPQLEEISKTTQAKQKAEAELKAKLEEEAKQVKAEAEKKAKAQAGAKVKTDAKLKQKQKAEEEAKNTAQVRSLLDNTLRQESSVEEIVKNDGTKIKLARNSEGQIRTSVIEKPDGTTIALSYGDGRRYKTIYEKGCTIQNPSCVEYFYNSEGKISSIRKGNANKIFNYDKGGKFTGYIELDYKNNVKNVYDAKGKLTDTVSDFSTEIENAVCELNGRHPFDKNMIINGNHVVRKTTVLDRETGKKVDAYITQSKNGGGKTIYVQNGSNYESIGSVSVDPNYERFGQTLETVDKSMGYSYDIKNLYGSKSQKVNRYKGAGIELLKQCSIDSFNIGKNGTFDLTSGNSVSDSFYRHIGLSGDEGFFKLPECRVASFLLQ